MLGPYNPIGEDRIMGQSEATDVQPEGEPTPESTPGLTPDPAPENPEGDAPGE